MCLLSSIVHCQEDLGPSILWQQSNLPPGSPKTPHDVVAFAVKCAKVFYSTYLMEIEHEQLFSLEMKNV